MTLKAAQIDEDEYFARMVSDDVERILKELKQARSGVNCTPFVRQYGILFRKWGVFI